MQRGCRSPWRVECGRVRASGSEWLSLAAAPDVCRPSRVTGSGGRLQGAVPRQRRVWGVRRASRGAGSGLVTAGGRASEQTVSHHLNLGFNGCRGRRASAFSIETRQMTGRGQSHVGGCSKPCLLAGRGRGGQRLDRRRVSRGAAGKECKMQSEHEGSRRSAAGGWAVQALTATVALGGLVEGRGGHAGDAGMLGCWGSVERREKKGSQRQ